MQYGSSSPAISRSTHQSYDGRQPVQPCNTAAVLAQVKPKHRDHYGIYPDPITIPASSEMEATIHRPL